MKTRPRIAVVSGLCSLLAVLALGLLAPAQAKISGICSNCHTMHNSQDGSPMAIFGTSTGEGPNEYLTRGDCAGCHAMGTPDRIYNMGGSAFPQVLHNDADGDLAAGNFGYINGVKSSATGASDTKGHNVVDLFGSSGDARLGPPPGGIVQSFHTDGFNVNDMNLTCAGDNGCHGSRQGEFFGGVGSGLIALGGAHHGNVDGKCDQATSIASSYRFLLGVKGLESSPANPADKWQNIDANRHNEYYGQTSPPVLTCSGGALSQCHFAGGIRPPTGTISGLCGTCHGNFHTLQTSPTANDRTSGQSRGIGDAVSPFIRHPTDIVLPADLNKEYKDYTVYNVNAPVGRTAVPDTVSSAVTPGSDVVTCLSCHVAHASAYQDMLRWEYDGMRAHDASADVGNGCFICHTTKDNP